MAEARPYNLYATEHMGPKSDSGEALWRHGSDPYLPLSVAAATAFHSVHHGAQAITNRREYDDALNMTAAALAGLIPLYVLKDPRRGRQRLAFDAGADRFTRGATRLVQRNGSVVSGLAVLRTEFTDALRDLRKAGLPLFVAPAPGSAEHVAASLSPKGNRLLAALPEEEYAALDAALELVPLAVGDVLFTEHDEVHHVHFPIGGVVSLLYITAEGEPTEIAVVGNEGVVGLAVLLGAASTPRRAVVQIRGHAYRIAAQPLLEQFRRGGALQALVLRYVQTLINQIAQTAVCNRHHSIEQQLCRWLLLSQDRTGSSDVLMTQELISQMLGVRRSGINQAAKKLQTLGLIDYWRGHIVIRNRAKLQAHACECYGIVKAEAERVMLA